ncbi:MAG: hypothetical protein KGQ58_07605 [Proteobacteria bacterium]|nr:hypothetical protein [Pseudomonadota bacterium]
MDLNVNRIKGVLYEGFTWYLVLSLFLLALIRPGQEALAGTFAPQWVTIRISPLIQVSYPLDNWRLLGRMDDEHRVSGGWDMQMLDGQRWVTSGDEVAGELGLQSSQVAHVLHAFPDNGALVFARYNPGSALLRIDVVKVEKHPDGDVYTYLAQYTPWHGNVDAANRRYMTPAEQGDPYAAGHNPFAAFEGPDKTDPDFHHVNFSAVQVAVGSAMRHYNASMALIAVFSPRYEESQVSSGGWFRKTVTTTVRGYAHPEWFMATPLELQPAGTSSSICVVDKETPCAPEHVDPSGVSVQHWEGGNVPGNEDGLYTWSQTESGWTVLSFSLVFAAVLTVGWGVGLPALFNGPAGLSWTGAAGSSSLSSLVGTFAVSGTTYATGSMIGKIGSVQHIQNGLFGHVDTGQLLPPSAANAQVAGLNTAMDARIDTNITHSLSSVTTLFSGRCPDGWTLQKCQGEGLDPGQLFRPDTRVQFNSTHWMRQHGPFQARGVMGNLRSEGIYLSSGP